MPELAQPHRTTEALAGLDCVHLAQGDLDQAEARMVKILRYLDTRVLGGARAGPRLPDPLPCPGGQQRPRAEEDILE